MIAGASTGDCPYDPPAVIFRAGSTPLFKFVPPSAGSGASPSAPVGLTGPADRGLRTYEML